MRQPVEVVLLTAFAAFALSPPQVTAGAIPITPPIGLAPGQQYQLIFVTTNTIEGWYTTEAPYNAFVNSEAALNPDLPATTWKAVTSTVDHTHANTNAPWLGLPVYNTLGQQVNPPGHSIYAVQNESAGIQRPYKISDQFGNFNPVSVWTGSDEYGNSLKPLGIGGFIRLAEYGYNVSDVIHGDQWLTFLFSNTAALKPVYALSGALTYHAVPEPSSFVMVGLGLLGVVALRKKLRRD